MRPTPNQRLWSSGLIPHDRYFNSQLLELRGPSPVEAFEARTELNGRSSEWQDGEHKMAAAMMSQCLVDLQKPDKPGYRSAVEWVRCRQDWAYSFDAVCELLGLNAGATRARLLSKVNE